MFLLLFALAIGLCVALVWSSVFDTHGPWNSFFWFFLVIFLFSWGGGSWIAPFGPMGWGVPWLPILLMGVFMALLLTAATPRSARRRNRPKPPTHQGSNSKAKAMEAVKIVVAVDLFFWALIVVLGCLALSNVIGRSRGL
ncbi:MAG TPA: hypothetical protein VK914_02730 [bacterium]|nr:hypothetical protein [bacterium]